MAGSKNSKLNWELGTVHWFDEKSGEGVIKSGDGASYYVHYSAIESTKKWKSLKPKSKVKFQVLHDLTFSQISKVKEL